MRRSALQLRYSFIIAGKNARIYYLKGPVLIFGLLFPLALFLAFSIGRNLPVDVLMPGLVGITLFFTSSSANPVIAPWETRMRTLERLISTPASVHAVILGDILAGFVFGAVISIFPLLIGILLSGLHVENPSVMAGNILMSAFCFSALGTIFSVPPSDNPSNIMMLSNVIRLPLIFISGVFIPVSEMPGWAKTPAHFSPLTYSIDLAQYSLSSSSYYPVWLSVPALCVFIVLLTTISIRMHIKTMPSRLP